jgi:acetyl esterase/lipase
VDASSDASFAVIRAKPLSQWKGIASAQSALPAIRLCRPGCTTPEGRASSGGLVYAHGGGRATGLPETVNEHCGRLAADAGVVVVSLDYRLVPRAPLPRRAR